MANKTPATQGIAGKFVRYVLGFSVAVAVGLAPFLGNASVPGFVSLLEIFPDSERGTLIPVSAMLMGLVSLVTQYWQDERVSRQRLRILFTRLAAASVLLLGIFYVAQSFVVKRIENVSEQPAAFIIGPSSSRTPACACPPDMDDGECIENITFDTTQIERCYGSRNIQLGRLLISLPYLAFAGVFGAMVGVLLLREETTKTDRRKDGGQVRGESQAVGGDDTLASGR